MQLIPFPNKDAVKLKDHYVKRYKMLLGDRYDDYLKYSFSFLTRSIRVNTLKTSIKSVKESLADKGWRLEQIPFCPEGFWVEHKDGRLDIGNTAEHALGYIYVQEAASMIPPLVLDPKPGEIVLDMCASPGSKSSQMAQYMGSGILVSNDFTADRMKPLGLNIQRMGLTNVIITKMYGQWFSKKNILFDMVLVDAPCSGTGTIRKSLKTVYIWNPTMITRLAVTQKKLLQSAFDALKPGGRLVYSTCSLEPEEDEGVISHFLENNATCNIEDITININRSEPVTEFEGKKYDERVRKCLRIWPQDNNTEGFFVARLSKSR